MLFRKANFGLVDENLEPPRGADTAFGHGLEVNKLALSRQALHGEKAFERCQQSVCAESNGSDCW